MGASLKDTRFYQRCKDSINPFEVLRWQSKLWAPTSKCFHTDCSQLARGAVLTVLAVAYRAHWQQLGALIGSATRRKAYPYVMINAPIGVLAWEALPTDLWYIILSCLLLSQLGLRQSIFAT